MFFRNKDRRQEADTGYYKVNADCQIPHLDWLYEKYFGQINDGFFVEVGAYDGEYVSNTCALADMGWRGLYVEPVPEFFEKCRARHAGNAGVRVDNMAIGPCKGEVAITLAGPLSSIDRQTTEIFKGLAWAKSLVSDRRIPVSQDTLDAYLSQRGVQPGFELLVVDVEGYEAEVMSGFDLSVWQPVMIIIELHDQNMEYRETMEKNERLAVSLDRAGYVAAYKDFTNTVYVRK